MSLRAGVFGCFVAASSSAALNVSAGSGSGANPPPATSKPDCNYPKDKVGKLFGNCFHIYQGGAGSGITEKNCADIVGDLAFMFPRGFARYYEGGYIAQVHWAVTKFGDYQKCNHPPDSHVYTCEPVQELAGHMERAKKGHWYSFPAKGKDKEWSSVGALSKGADCAVLRIKSICLFGLMAKANGKPGKCAQGCDKLSSAECADCLEGLSQDKEIKVWNDAFFNEKCPRIYDNQDELLGDELNLTGALDPELDRTVTWGFWRRPPFWNGTSSDEQSTDSLLV